MDNDRFLGFEIQSRNFVIGLMDFLGVSTKRLA